MSEPNRQKQVLFIVIGGVLLTIMGIAASMVAARLGVKNIFLLNAIVYAVELGAYCLAMFLYRVNISHVVWFSQGFVVLIFLTLVKVVLSVFVYYFIFAINRQAYYFENGAVLFLGLLGSFMRGFLFELPLMALAARIFETDIFKKHESRDTRIIDDQLK